MRSFWGPDFVSVWWFRQVLCVWRGKKKKILSLKCGSAFWPVHSCCVGGLVEPFKGFSLIIRVMLASCVWWLKICWRWRIFPFCNECFQMQNFIRPLWFILTIQQLLHQITCTCKHHFQELDTWPLTFFVGAFFFSAYRFFVVLCSTQTDEVSRPQVCRRDTFKGQNWSKKKKKHEMFSTESADQPTYFCPNPMSLREY